MTRPAPTRNRLLAILGMAVLMAALCAAPKTAHAAQRHTLTLVPASERPYQAKVVNVCDTNLNVSDAFNETVTATDVVAALSGDGAAKLARAVDPDRWQDVSSATGPVELEDGWYLIACASGVYAFAVDGTDVDFIEKPVIASTSKEVSVRPDERTYRDEDAAPANVGDTLLWHVRVEMPAAGSARKVTVTDTLSGADVSEGTLSVLCDGERVEATLERGDDGLSVTCVVPPFASTLDVRYETTCTREGRVDNRARATITEDDGTYETAEAYAAAVVGKTGQNDPTSPDGDESPTKPATQASAKSPSASAASPQGLSRTSDPTTATAGVALALALLSVACGLRARKTRQG